MTDDLGASDDPDTPDCVAAPLDPMLRRSENTFVLASDRTLKKWVIANGGYTCASCGARTSVTAGTLFDRRRKPLNLRFEGCWMFASQKEGMSALSLQQSLEIGSNPIAWEMLHQRRGALVRPGRDRLTGAIEVGDTYVGGAKPALRGGRYGRIGWGENPGGLLPAVLLGASLAKR